VNGGNWFMVTRNEKFFENSAGSSNENFSENSVPPAPVSWGEGYILRPERVPSMEGGDK
jgi:hypothetical protein